MTQQIPPNSGALLLRQVGEVLYGPSWQADLSAQISGSDRSMRRWASGEDAIPPGVWRDIHYVAESKWRTVKYFDEEVVKLLEGISLQPIPNTRPMPDSWGLFFSMATKLGRPVRCYIHREVLDDRVSYNPMKNVLDYFGEHAEVFYRVARRKFDAGEMDGNLLRITNDDFEVGELPDVRGSWRAPNLEPRLGHPQASREAQPNSKRFTVRRILGHGDLWISELIITYDGRPSHSLSIMEFEQGKVARETQYFGDPFEPGPSRAQWVELTG